MAAHLLMILDILTGLIPTTLRISIVVSVGSSAQPLLVSFTSGGRPLWVSFAVRAILEQRGLSRTGSNLLSDPLHERFESVPEPGAFTNRSNAIFWTPCLALNAWGIAEHAVHQLPDCRDVNKAAKS